MWRDREWKEGGFDNNNADGIAPSLYDDVFNNNDVNKNYVDLSGLPLNTDSDLVFGDWEWNAQSQDQKDRSDKVVETMREIEKTHREIERLQARDKKSFDSGKVPSVLPNPAFANHTYNSALDDWQPPTSWEVLGDPWAHEPVLFPDSSSEEEEEEGKKQEKVNDKGKGKEKAQSQDQEKDQDLSAIVKEGVESVKKMIEEFKGDIESVARKFEGISAVSSSSAAVSTSESSIEGSREATPTPAQILGLGDFDADKAKAVFAEEFLKAQNIETKTKTKDDGTAEELLSFWCPDGAEPPTEVCAKASLLERLGLEEERIHRGVTCDECHERVEGARYKCQNCDGSYSFSFSFILSICANANGLGRLRPLREVRRQGHHALSQLLARLPPPLHPFRALGAVHPRRRAREHHLRHVPVWRHRRQAQVPRLRGL